MQKSLENNFKITLYENYRLVTILFNAFNVWDLLTIFKVRKESVFIFYFVYLKMKLYSLQEIFGLSPFQKIPYNSKIVIDTRMEKFHGAGQRQTRLSGFQFSR